MVLTKLRGHVPFEKCAELREIFVRLGEGGAGDGDSIPSVKFHEALQMAASPEAFKRLSSTPEAIRDLLSVLVVDGVVPFIEFVSWYPTITGEFVTEIAVSEILSEEDAASNTAAEPPVKPGSRIEIQHLDALRSKLPSEKTPDAKAKRQELFRRFDPNGNGYLSLAEIDKGFRDLKIDEVFNCKPVLMRAFQAARKINDARNKPSSHGRDYVEASEFRMLLWYVRQYFELWNMFSGADTSGDRRIEMSEFEEAVQTSKMQRGWGLAVTDAAAEFRVIDKNHGGFILFDEFAEWALEKGLGLEEDDE